MLQGEMRGIVLLIYFHLISSLEAFCSSSLIRYESSGLRKSNVGGVITFPLFDTNTNVDENLQEGRERLRDLRRYVQAQRRRAVTEQEANVRQREDAVLLFLALSPAFVAFISWKQISLGMATLVDMYGAMGKAVDGNAFANQLLRPTITGVVVPVIAIALATLVSTTVNVLRDRQIQLRSLVNKEACDIRLLRRAILGMFGTKQHAGRRLRAFELLKGYARQISSECQNEARDNLKSLQVTGGIAVNELDRLSSILHGVDGAAASRQGSVDNANVIISRLNEYRSDRVALVLSVFPAIHWVVLIALSVFICITFLLESNQSVNQYLNSIQLRSLFAMLVGVFSATATLCYDLADPFTGSFSIETASTQLGDLQICLQEDLREARSECGAVAVTKRAGSFLEEDSQRDNGNRFGLFSTIYFHLLTGPFGSHIRAVGEATAWGISLLRSKTSALFKWSRSSWSKGN